MKVKQADARRHFATPPVCRIGTQKEHDPVLLQEPVQLDPPPPVAPATQ
jgi:hypothetical protein